MRRDERHETMRSNPHPTSQGITVMTFLQAPGFLIEPAAYMTFMVETGLDERIVHVLGETDVEDRAALNQAAVDIQLSIEAMWIPRAVRAAIVDRYSALSDDEMGMVTVRSSATGAGPVLEALAHLNDTAHPARGTSAVLKSVRRCWASAFSARAIRLRDKVGLAHTGLDVAVLVCAWPSRTAQPEMSKASACARRTRQPRLA
jgi:pyruvate,water dikinase